MGWSLNLTEYFEKSIEIGPQVSTLTSATSPLLRRKIAFTRSTNSSMLKGLVK